MSPISRSTALRIQPEVPGLDALGEEGRGQPATATLSASKQASPPTEPSCRMP